MPLFVIETIQTFRHKYVVECEELSHAFDTVVMDGAEEFSQMYLGAHIVTGREITEDEYDKMVTALENYGDGTHYQPETGSYWMGKKLINKVNYDGTEVVRASCAET